MHINARPFGERREAEVAGKIDRYLARDPSHYFSLEYDSPPMKKLLSPSTPTSCRLQDVAAAAAIAPAAAVVNTAAVVHSHESVSAAVRAKPLSLLARRRLAIFAPSFAPESSVVPP